MSILTVVYSGAIRYIREVMLDKFVFDIETKNTFADVGGQEHVGNLEVSFVGVYSYNQDKYLSFRENQLKELESVMRNAGLIIGFSINRFDVPVLAKYFDFDIWKIERLDLLDEIESASGMRVGLDILARTNLGTGKTSHGLEAIKFYKEGNWQALEEYCLNDVKITKELYEMAKRKGYLVVPQKLTGALSRVELQFQDLVFHPTLF